jgi:hypothetical protein
MHLTKPSDNVDGRALNAVGVEGQVSLETCTSACFTAGMPLSGNPRHLRPHLALLICPQAPSLRMNAVSFPPISKAGRPG